MSKVSRHLLNKMSISCIFLLFFVLILIDFYSPHSIGASGITGEARKFQLENGLKVILKEDHSSPVASIQIWVKTGSANESEEEAGITHVIEHMIFKGTPERNTGEIAGAIESSGGNINAYTSSDRTVYFLEIDSDNFETGLAVLLDAVQNSLFDPLELAREKEVVLEEYRRSLDIPERRLSSLMLDLSFKVHPYRRPVIGYDSTIKSIKREDILRYMDKWYTAGNMVLVAVGDINTAEALEAIRAQTKKFPVRPGHAPERPAEPPQTSPRSKVIEAPVQQVYMDMSWHIPSLTHPHIPALDLLEVIMGQGRSSRLYTSLRMRKNLVRNIGAGTYAMIDPGLFSIESTLGPGKIRQAMEAIAREIAEITFKPVSDSELSRAKRIAEADYLSEMETMKGQARTLAFFELMTGDMGNAADYLERLRAVTAADIIKVAGLYLQPGNLSIGMVVPEDSGIQLSKDQILEIFSQKSDNNPLKKETREKAGASRVILQNGIRVIIEENHRLPLVSARVAFLGGTRLEKTEVSGISEFVGRMITRGTTRRNAAEIASIVESWGGELKGFSGRNSFGISANFLSEDLYPGLELIADIILNPSFPESEIGKVREDIISDIAAKKDSPMRQLSEEFNKTLYRNHPYGRPGTGTAESIRSVKRSALFEWYKSLAVSSNMVIVLVGNVKKDELVGRLEALFKDLDATPFEPPEILSEPSIEKERELHLERPGNQTHIMVGYLGADLRSRDNAVMTLIDTALSGQGGRLFTELRDKNSLAYSVSSLRRPGLETGMFGIYLACDPQKLPRAREAIFREIEKIREEGLSRQELENSKRYVIGNDAIEHQTNSSKALRMAIDELYGLGYDHSRKFIQEIKDISLEDTREAAKRIFIPNGHVIVTVGPSR